MSGISRALPTAILILVLCLSPSVVVWGYASQGITVPSQENHSAQPMQSQQPLTDLPLLQNGGFESGLAGWTEIQGTGGSIARSSITVHSGSAALVISLAPRAGATASTPAIEGASQSATVTNLRGLRVQAWYLLQTNTYLVATRIRIEAGNLKLNYYAVISSQTVLSSTLKMKSILLPPKNCTPWCLLEADVGADIRSYFDSAAFAAVFQGTQPIPVKIALEFLLYGGNDRQFVYWDDVELIASIPSQTTTTTSAFSISSSSSTTSTSRPVTITSVSTQTSTLTSTPTAGFVLTSKQNYPVLVTVLVLILIATLLEFARMKRNTRKLSHLSKTDMTNEIQCLRCGTNLARTDKFCHRCGTVQ